MVRSYRWTILSLVAALLAGTAIWWFAASKPAPQAVPAPVAAVQSAPAPAPAVPAPAERWARWGGALCSAQPDGTGFFDRHVAREFIKALAPVEQPYAIGLNARVLLPQIAAAHGLLRQDGQAQTLYMQFFDNPTDAQWAQLAATGVARQNYVSAYAWIARGTSEALDAALQLPFVRALAEIDPRDKLNPGVFLGLTPPYALAPDGQTRFRVLAAPHTAPAEFSAAVAAAPALARATVLPSSASVLGPRFEVVAHADQATALAALELTAFVEYVAPPVGQRDVTTDTQSHIKDIRDSAPNLDGTGITVAVREIGKPDAHVDFDVGAQLGSGTRTVFINTDGDTTDPGNVDHATGVVGLVGSSGVNRPAAKGVAPNVNMLILSLGTTDADAYNTDGLTSAATNYDARISNHSYGPTGLLATDLGTYETDSANWDAALRASNLLAMFAGNELGPQQSQQIDYFVGMKNDICVTATKFTGVSATPAISSYSQYGPMNDGRVKPDLVAFGGDFNPDGTSPTAAPPGITLDQGTNATTIGMVGTSFATPAVTGVAALVFQCYKQQVGAEPSAAMAKALLCNTADDLGSAGPDQVYGFGLLDAQAAVNQIQLYTGMMNTPFFEGALTNGQTQNFAVTVPQGFAGPLRVTLCWLDVPGNPSAAKALVNELDLELISPALPDGSTTTIYPYSLSAENPAAAATATGPNHADPVQQVVVATPITGVWTLRVLGGSVPQGPQLFALCADVVGQDLIAASIAPSPTSGVAPLTVTFDGTQSTGLIAQYTWDFGDDSTVDTTSGAIATHTYTLPGTYTATLTVSDGLPGAGHTSDPVTATIIVNQREVQAYPYSFTCKLAWNKPQASTLQFSMIATDPAVQLTPQQARNAIKNGTFEGLTFKLITEDFSAAVPAPQSLYAFSLDRKGQERDPLQSIKVNFVKGLISVVIKQAPGHPLLNSPANPTGPTFSGMLGIDATTPTLSVASNIVRMQLLTADATYTADFPRPAAGILKYTKGKTSGVLKFVPQH